MVLKGVSYRVLRNRKYLNGRYQSETLSSGAPTSCQENKSLFYYPFRSKLFFCGSAVDTSVTARLAY